MSAAEADSFIETWLVTEHWHRLLLVFETPELRLSRRLLETLGHALRSAALDSSDARVVAAKLGWWAQEWQRLAAGRPSHPLSRALLPLARHQDIDEAAGVAWVAAASALADEPAAMAAALERWQVFSQAQQKASQAWLPGTMDDARTHGLCLSIERLPLAAADLERGRLSIALPILARIGVTRADLAADRAAAGRALATHARECLDTWPSPPVARDAYRRGQLALARRLATAIARDGAVAWAGRRPALPRLRSAFSVWRAWRAGS